MTSVPSCASSVKKGPSTVDSVAPGGLVLYSESINVETPRISESKMNSVSTDIPALLGRIATSLLGLLTLTCVCAFLPARRQKLNGSPVRIMLSPEGIDERNSTTHPFLGGC